MRHRLPKLTILLLFPLLLSGQSWEEAITAKSATLDVHWSPSVPFIYADANADLAGIEFELMSEFQQYLRNEKNIELKLNWNQTSFSDIIRLVKEGRNDVIGISAFSITDERKEFAKFSDAYLPDVTVLVSSKGTPIVSSFEEIHPLMSKMQAISMPDTKYQALLLDLEKQLNVNFDIMYLNSDQNVLEYISAKSDRFGFIDLPIYLMLMKNGGELVRQNFFTVKGEGYGIILSQNSDWDIPFNEFLNDPGNESLIASIFSKYLGEELYSFIQNMDSEDELSTSILTKEKELQLELIRNANLRLEKEQTNTNILIFGISITALFLIIIGFLFYKNQRTTKLLMGQKDRIFDQQEDIHQKNEQLMNRNAQLMAINEEKNNLVKILAHDIRSPLSQIIMIGEILKSSSEEAELKKPELLKQMGLSANRINEMVTKILDLDSIEEDRLKVMRERIDVREILKEMKSRYSGSASKKGITLRVSSCDSNNIIRTDHLLLTLVLENLVTNALKFSPSETTVSVEADCKYDGVIFKVSDEGPGFTEEDKKNLFNRFQKLSAKPTAGESSIGLGLSIVKKYVHDLEGEVWLESQEGKGSTFFVKLMV